MNQWNKPALGSQIDPQHPLSQGCVMALCMLEGAGNRTYDLTHNGNDGVLTNGPLWKPGRNGAAIEFDGARDYVNVGNPPNLKSIQSISISVSFRLDSFTAGTYSYLVAKDQRHTGQLASYFAGVSHNSGKIQFRVYNAAGNPVSLEVGPVISFGRFYTFTGTYDGAMMRVFFDGTYVNGIAQSTGISLTNSIITIGDGYGVGNNPFQGSISDVRIWNRALSPDEVQDLYINPYGFIYQPQKYWLMPQGVTIPPHLFRRAA